MRKSPTLSVKVCLSRQEECYRESSPHSPRSLYSLCPALLIISIDIIVLKDNCLKIQNISHKKKIIYLYSLFSLWHHSHNCFKFMRAQKTRPTSQQCGLCNCICNMQFFYILDIYLLEYLFISQCCQMVRMVRKSDWSGSGWWI